MKNIVELKFCYKLNHKKEKKVQPHFHNCYEVVYFFKANGKSYLFPRYDEMLPAPVRDDNNKFLFINARSASEEHGIGDNSLFFYAPNYPHSEKHFSEANGITLGFSLENASLPMQHLFFHDSGRIFHNTFLRIMQEWDDKNALYVDQIENLIQSVLLALIRTNLSADRFLNPLQFAKEYIDQYFSTEIHINEIAAQIGYSTDYFTVLFRKEYGITPKQYLINKRIALAIEMIEQTDLPFMTIATAVGYPSYKNFVLLFEKQTGISPSDYRKTRRGTN